MGTQLNVYVGAYLKVKAEKVPANTPYICPEHSSNEFLGAWILPKVR